MVDKAIELINNIGVEELTFQWFRSTLKADNGLKESLQYGHAIIKTTDQLDQYLYTYGLMIESQWENIIHHIDQIANPTTMIDYGCGQGLAGLLIHDLTDGALFARVKNVILIEPSAVALARARAIYSRLVPTATISCIGKRFDDLVEGDIPAAADAQILHVFSNTLDVLGFAPLTMFPKTIGSGNHTILSVSHDRSFNGGTPRVEQIKGAFENLAMEPGLTIRRSESGKFTCDNGSAGYFWICELEVENE